MAWTPPYTPNPNDMMTAAIWDVQVRDNLNLLKTSISDSGTVWSGDVALPGQATNRIPYAASAVQLVTSASLTFNGSLLAVIGSVSVNPATVSGAFLSINVGGVNKALIGLSGAIKGTSAVDLGFESVGGMTWMVNGGIVDSMTLSSSAVLAVTGAGVHTFTGGASGSNATSGLNVSNVHAGAAAISQIVMDNDARISNMTLRSYGSGWATSIPDVPDSVLLRANGAGGLTLSAQHASGVQRFLTAGAERMRLHASGGFTIGDTTDPGAQSLRVVGTTQLVGNLSATTDARFGTTSNFNWQTKLFNTAYLAASDGFVVAYVGCVSPGTIGILSDSANPPTTARVGSGGTTGDVIDAMSPVKKGDYYMVATSGGATDSPVAWWIPLGFNG